MTGFLSSLFSSVSSTNVNRTVNISEFFTLHSNGDVDCLVDVRSAAEYAQGHVPGAINIPLHELTSRLHELADFADATIHLICASGARSGRAQALLVANEFRAVNVMGGTMGWAMAGNSVQ